MKTTNTDCKVGVTLHWYNCDPMEVVEARTYMLRIKHEDDLVRTWEPAGAGPIALVTNADIGEPYIVMVGADDMPLCFIPGSTDEETKAHDEREPLEAETASPGPLAEHEAEYNAAHSG